METHSRRGRMVLKNLFIINTSNLFVLFAEQFDLIYSYSCRKIVSNHFRAFANINQFMTNHNRFIATISAFN